MQTREVGCLMSQTIWKPFLRKRNVNNNVCEVRSLCMEGIFENMPGFMYIGLML